MVRHRDVQLQLARRRIHGCVHARHPAAESGVGCPGDHQDHGSAHAHVGGVLARDCGCEFELGRVDELEQQIAVLHAITRVYRALADHAARGRSYGRFVELLPCLGRGCLGGPQAHFGVFDVPLRHRAFLEQALHALVVRSRQASLCLGGERGRLGGAGPEACQRLPLAHRLPFLDQHFLDHLGDGRRNADHERGLEGAGHRHARDQVSAGRPGDVARTEHGDVGRVRWCARGRPGPLAVPGRHQADEDDARKRASDQISLHGCASFRLEISATRSIGCWTTGTGRPSARSSCASATR